MSPDCTTIADFLGSDRVVIVVLNYNTATDTLECLASLQRHCTTKIVLLDNASIPEDVAMLRDYTANRCDILLLANATNLGFAAAHNRILAVLLENTAVQFVILLNSDTVVGNDVVACLCAATARASADMVAGRMLLHDQDAVESLGICYYRSGLASNRKSLAEPLLGPTGGCALYTRYLLETVHDAHGELFDELFFCYAEDTDLALRARLLGFRAALANDTVIQHKLGRSSGGKNSLFILYHGIRNSLMTLAKSWPNGMLLKHSPWIGLMLISVVIRHWRWAELKVVLRAYRDALRFLPTMLRKRRRIQTTYRPTLCDYRQLISRRFYDPEILRSALRSLWSYRGS